MKAAKQKTILAQLLLHRDEVVSVDRLKEALWGESPPSTAGTALQGYVSQLRRMLESGAKGRASLLVTRSPGYALTATTEQVDLSRFEELVSSGREALATGESERAASLLAEGLALWRGEPLADFSYEPWAQPVIGQLEELRLAALEDRIDADLATGRHSELVGELELLITEHPLRERPRSQLMLALYRSGRQAEALEAYQAARHALVEELGIEPGPDLQEMNRLILNQDEALAAPPRAGPAPRTELPAPATPLIGRRDELVALADLLTREDVRLVTVTGTGGAGKTRLALEAARHLSNEFPDGVFWVSLAPLRDPSLVLPTVARALRAKAELPAHLAGKELLLVLDNLEQLLECGPELSLLLSGSPTLTLLATSREPLRLSAEYEYPVPALGEVDAIALFAERARQHKPTFEVVEAVTEISRRLDRLPLALELAAARVKVLAPEEILERLDESLNLLTAGSRDAPERQRTLRATIAWSYELLGAQERGLFGRLAVFGGSFDLDAAETVCDAELDGLHTLVDRSLLHQTEESRFFLLQTIREYALELLDSDPRRELLRQRHAEHFLKLAQQASVELPFDAPARVLPELSPEQDNLRVALSWATSHAPDDVALPLALAMDTFWHVQGAFAEGRRAFEHVLEASDPRSPLRGRALASSGILAHRLGEFEEASRQLTEAIDIAAELGDVGCIAVATNGLGVIAGLAGHPDAARCFRDSLVALDSLEDVDSFRLDVLANLGRALFEQGDPDGAEAVLLEAIEVERTPFALNVLARISSERGDISMARELVRESLALTLGDPWLLAEELEEVSSLFVTEHKVVQAGRLWGAAEALRERIAAPLGPAERTRFDTSLAELQPAFGEAFDVARKEGRTMTLEQAVEYALEYLD